MNKYNVEGNINFFEELYKSLDIEENELKTDEDNNKCLITNTPLIDKHMELKCGHKFNYIPLFYDLVNHKKKFNNMEGQNTRLNLNEIRCPYCRNKQTSILPYYEDLGLEKVNGVNFYDPNLKQTNNNYSNYKGEKCCYLLENNLFNSNEPESNNNKKYIECGGWYSTKIMLYNEENPSEPVTYGDDKCYCYSHKKLMIKHYKQKLKEKEKEEKKQAKLQEKLQIKEAKELAKTEEKAAKKLAKEEAKTLKKNSNNQNIILGPSIIENQIGVCIQILKTGPNKGNACGCKIVSENLCKRHFLLNHKELILNN